MKRSSSQLYVDGIGLGWMGWLSYVVGSLRATSVLITNQSKQANIDDEYSKYRTKSIWKHQNTLPMILGLGSICSIQLVSSFICLTFFFCWRIWVLRLLLHLLLILFLFLPWQWEVPPELKEPAGKEWVRCRSSWCQRWGVGSSSCWWRWWSSRV